MLRRVLFAALFTLLLCSPVFAMKNEPDGFGGIKWDQSQSLFAEYFVKIEEHSKTWDCYRKKNENLQFGSATTKSIEYYFDDIGLVIVRFDIQGRSNIEKALTNCISQWGAPDSKTQYGDPVWEGNTVRCIFFWKNNSESAKLEIRSVEGFARFTEKFKQGFNK